MWLSIPKPFSFSSRFALTQNPTATTTTTTTKPSHPFSDRQTHRATTQKEKRWHTRRHAYRIPDEYFNTISRFFFFFFKWDDVKKSPCPCLLYLVTQLWVLRSHSPPPPQQQHSLKWFQESLIVSHADLIAYSQWVEFKERVVNVRTKLGEISRELPRTPSIVVERKKKTNNSKDNFKKTNKTKQ